MTESQASASTRAKHESRLTTRPWTTSTVLVGALLVLIGLLIGLIPRAGASYSAKTCGSPWAPKLTVECVEVLGASGTWAASLFGLGIALIMLALLPTLFSEQQHYTRFSSSSSRVDQESVEPKSRSPKHAGRG